MKRIIAFLYALIIFFNPAAFAYEECAPCSNSCPTCLEAGETIQCCEHMFEEKGATNNQVIITNFRNVICKGNALKILFTCKLWSECAKAGDIVHFDVPEAIYTQEGTLLIPACSKIVASIIKIEKQRFPNKNARVYLNFDCLVLPDGTAIAMSAQPLTKDGALKEGPWHTAGKLAASTVGLGIVGAGAGTGFAFIPNPAKLGAGFAIGIPVGCAVGLITGLLTPGLKYHAKEGEAIRIILCENLDICKQERIPCQCQEN